MKIFENFILKTYFLTPWSTYATNWSDLNNFGRGLPRDHSCEVWSKSNKWFQRRSCLKKLLTHARTHGRGMTDNGPSQKLTLSTLCSGELNTDASVDTTFNSALYCYCVYWFYQNPRCRLENWIQYSNNTRVIGRLLGAFNIRNAGLVSNQTHYYRNSKEKSMYLVHSTRMPCRVRVLLRRPSCLESLWGPHKLHLRLSKVTKQHVSHKGRKWRIYMFIVSLNR